MWIFFVTLAGLSADQGLTLTIEKILSSPQGAGSQVWIYAGLSLLLNILFPLVLTLLTLSAFTPQLQAAGCFTSHYQSLLFFKHYFQQALIEQLRSLGLTLRWSLLLIVPGFIQFLRLLFVPFIVCFHLPYDAGLVDALEESRQRSRGKLLQLFGLFLFFSILLPATLTAFDEYKMIWKTPLQSIALSLIEMFLNVLFILFIWKIFNKGNQNESVSVLSMEGH